MQGEEERLGYGSSLPVPSVQEIVRNDSSCIPERYIKELKDRPLDSLVSHSSDIPIIRMSLLAGGDKLELEKLDRACKDWGFFQIVDHGIEDAVLDKMKAAMASFFDLPLEEKKKYARPANDIQGYGQQFVVSEEQKLDWGDMIFLQTYPEKYIRFKYWPLSLRGFKEAVENYSKELQKITEELFANLSILLGLEKDDLRNEHGEMRQGMRMNYYPPCLKPDLVLGISPHSDGGSITLLLQDDDITGLQIKHGGKWVPIKPIHNAIVINVGDALEVWSNGIYKSIEHRAVTNEKKARMSIAAFVVPADETLIGPLPPTYDDIHHPRLYRNIKFIDYIQLFLGRKLEGKTHTDYLKL